MANLKRDEVIASTSSTDESITTATTESASDERPFSGDKECSRQQQIKELLAAIIEKFVSSITWSSYKSHYRSFYERDKSSLRGLYLQLVQELKTRLTEEIDESILNNIFMTNLDKLDKLVNNPNVDVEQKSSESGAVATAKLWRPSRKPEKNLMPTRVAVKKEEKCYLESVLTDMKTKNELLRQRNLDDYHKICEYEQLIQIKKTTINKTVESCESLPITKTSKF